MKRIDWEMIAVIVTLLGVIYFVGKKEGEITTEVKQNRSAIERVSRQVDKLSADITTIIQNQPRKVSLHDLQEHQ